MITVTDKPGIEDHQIGQFVSNLADKMPKAFLPPPPRMLNRVKTKNFRQLSREDYDSFLRWTKVV